MTAEPPAFLVDTNVLSGQSDQSAGSPVERWIRLHARLIRISVITVAEARRGLVLGQRKVDALSDPRTTRAGEARCEPDTWAPAPA